MESHVVKYWGKGFSSKWFFVVKHRVRACLEWIPCRHEGKAWVFYKLTTWNLRETCLHPLVKNTKENPLAVLLRGLALPHKWMNEIPPSTSPKWNIIRHKAKAQKEAALLWSVIHEAVAVNECHGKISMKIDKKLSSLWSPISGID